MSHQLEDIVSVVDNQQLVAGDNQQLVAGDNQQLVVVDIQHHGAGDNQQLVVVDNQSFDVEEMLLIEFVEAGSPNVDKDDCLQKDEIS